MSSLEASLVNPVKIKRRTYHHQRKLIRCACTQWLSGSPIAVAITTSHNCVVPSEEQDNTSRPSALIATCHKDDLCTSTALLTALPRSKSQTRTVSSPEQDTIVRPSALIATQRTLLVLVRICMIVDGIWPLDIVSRDTSFLLSLLQMNNASTTALTTLRVKPPAFLMAPSAYSFSSSENVDISAAVLL